MGNTKLSPEQAKMVLEGAMKLTSLTSKIPFLETIMRENHINGRQQAIKEKVKAGLLSHSQTYMNQFSDFVCSAGNLADWLSYNFTDEDFNKFADEIGNIIIRVDEGNKDEIIKNKLQEIQTNMSMLQLHLSENLLKDCKDKEKSSII